MPQSALMSTLTLKRNPAAGSSARRMLNKVTVYFWVIKVLCTTVGETASDYLSENVGLGLTTTPATGLVASRGALRRARIPPTVSMRRRPGSCLCRYPPELSRVVPSRTGLSNAWLSEMQ